MSGTAKLLAAVAAVAVLGGVLFFVLRKGDGKTTTGPKGSASITQKTCPVMSGKKINPKIHTDHKGRRIYFCCADCVGKFKDDPEKYLKKVDAEIAGAQGAKAPDSGHEGHGH